MRLLDLFNKLLQIDRRIIYSLMFIGVTIPFYVSWPPIRIEVSPEVEDTFKIIDQIPPNSNPLLLSFDYDPASAAELTPMAKTVLHHCFSKEIRVLVISLQYSGLGAGIASEVVPEIAAEYGREKNVDWAFLGFQPNAGVAMLQIGEDIKTTFPIDYYGTPVDEIPLMESIQNYDQIPAVLSLASTAVGEFWAVYAGSRYGVTILTGLTAVYVADIQPFYQTGQIKGVLGGLKGAAEYEKKVGIL
ncbi:MAG: hypothetical protein KAY24_15270, partial [Candidatus Eisenbacteria sp.]|nr:hypothetical protein [Candidatus Eisenbacteria bacterium]